MIFFATAEVKELSLFLSAKVLSFVVSLSGRGGFKKCISTRTTRAERT